MGYAKEVIPGALWVAAAIEVAGYTWQAMTGTQVPSLLPSFNFGGAATTPLPGAGQAIPKGTPGTGGTPLEPPMVPSGPRVHAPPPIIVNPLIAAVNKHDKWGAILAYKNLQDWGNGTKAGKSQGWDNSTWSAHADPLHPTKRSASIQTIQGPIATWVSSQPWFNRFAQLTGANVIQAAG